MAVKNRSRQFYNSTTSSSARIRHKMWTSRKARSESLSSKGIQARKTQESQTQVFYPEPAVDDIDEANDEDWEMADCVLTGQTEASISHAGGELHSLLKEWVLDTERRRFDRFHVADRSMLMPTHTREKTTARDWRTRQDRILHQVADFELQMDTMVDAYMQWSCQGPQAFSHWQMPTAPCQTDSQSIASMTVIDIFGTWYVPAGCAPPPVLPPFVSADTASCIVPIRSDDTFISCALLRLGLVPCAPVRPTVAISIRALEFFCVSSLYSPHFTLHAFAKVLCHSHTVCMLPYSPSLLCIDLCLPDCFQAVLASPALGCIRCVPGFAENLRLACQAGSAARRAQLAPPELLPSLYVRTQR